MNVIKYQYWITKYSEPVDASISVCFNGFYRINLVNHGFSVGDVVFLSGWGLNPLMNGLHTVTNENLAANAFNIDVACAGAPVAEDGIVQVADDPLQVYPLGVDQLKLNYNKQEGRVFTRRDLTGSLVFINQQLGDDYDYFKAIDDNLTEKCVEIHLTIKRSCDNGDTYEDFWEGYFSTTDGEFNIDKCIFTVPIKTNDEYRCYIEGLENKRSPIVSYDADTTFYSNVIYEYYTCYFPTDPDCGTVFPYPSATWLLLHTQVYGGSTVAIWYREIQYVLCENGNSVAPEGVGWTLDTTYDNCSVGISKWVRTAVDVVTPNNPNPFVVAGPCTIYGTCDTPSTVPGFPPYQLVSECGVGPDEPCWFWSDPLSGPFVIPNTTTLQSISDYFSAELCSSENVVSDFFEWNPPGDTHGYVAGTNYVTGLPNMLTYLTITPARLFLYAGSGTASYLTPTKNDLMTFKMLEEIWREVFNAYWFIENGVLRVEHISWFNRSVKFDLTDSFYRKYSIGKNIYKYDKTDAPEVERFEWGNANQIDFVGADITYSGSCIDTDENTNISNRGVNFIETDLQMLPANYDLSSFILLVNDSSFNVLYDIGKISGLNIPNGHLSWANLHYNYHRYDRVILNGMMNLIPETFFTARKYKTQDNVTFPYCCEDDLNTLEDLITTGVGDGVIEEAEHDLKTDMIKVTLLHDF